MSEYNYELFGLIDSIVNIYESPYAPETLADPEDKGDFYIESVVIEDEDISDYLSEEYLVRITEEIKGNLEDQEEL